MVWAAAADSVLLATRGIWGQACTYTPIGTGIAVPITAILVREGETVPASQGAIVATTLCPRLIVRLVDLLAAPARGDLVAIGSVTYQVEDVVEDGDGSATLYLMAE